jgi:transglutaminase-like putative cysteine protease
LLIQVGYEIEFLFPQPTAMVLLLYLHPDHDPQIRVPENLIIEPAVPVSIYLDSYGNRCGRVFVPGGRVVFRNHAVVEDNGQVDVVGLAAWQHKTEELPNETLLFLLASRYCEVDSEMKEIAWSLFGHLPAGWPLVQGICDFVNQHICFDYQQARANRTALDAYRERTGVCRDYMHLAIVFCRCLNIPARYCTGYLGDIGVPPSANPMDFSAWFEVYLGNRWYPMDARNNTPRIGRLLMARGRDAADVALTTTFGRNQLTSFRVWTDEVAAG